MSKMKLSVSEIENMNRGRVVFHIFSCLITIFGLFVSGLIILFLYARELFVSLPITHLLLLSITFSLPLVIFVSIVIYVFSLRKKDENKKGRGHHTQWRSSSALMRAGVISIISADILILLYYSQFIWFKDLLSGCFWLIGINLVLLFLYLIFKKYDYWK
ncbi:MAG: hypothetical protein WCY12_03315 [Candidatus Omnitrophota bacterium]